MNWLNFLVHWKSSYKCLFKKKDLSNLLIMPPSKLSKISASVPRSSKLSQPFWFSVPFCCNGCPIPFSNSCKMGNRINPVTNGSLILIISTGGPTGCWTICFSPLHIWNQMGDAMKDSILKSYPLTMRNTFPELGINMILIHNNRFYIELLFSL